MNGLDDLNALVDQQDQEEFEVGSDSFSDLEVRPSGSGGFHYFFNTKKNRLVKSFVLRRGSTVSTHCQVTLIKNGEDFTPRLRFVKRKNTGATAEENVSGVAIAVKSSVDLKDCHAEFWELVAFLEEFLGVQLPDGKLAVTSSEAAELSKALGDLDKDEVLEAVRVRFDGDLTDADVALLTNRRQGLSEFERLLQDPEYFEERKVAAPNTSGEWVWQEFFERNSWILGYGLSLVSCDAYSPERLEQWTTGGDVFSAGKRVDGLLRTRAFVSSLLFAEIKRHDTDLLRTAAYRKPDVYSASPELVGGVAQLQKTAQKALHKIDSLFQSHYPDGSPGEVLSTVRPRQVLLIGRLNEFDDGVGVNLERMSSFELYRRSILDVAIITFDELYQRATFIVGD